MTQYWLIGVAAAALVLALVSLIAIARTQSALKAQTSNARWLQARMERIENEQGSIESALAGLGRHMEIQPNAVSTMPYVSVRKAG
ncbi:MAG: hypothetical protein B7X28_03705 [Halothiobacillus sp. 13-55-253]|nr:MAG: hypothetical protein B7X28_03705 [Halothiobacillus sp. 13-55-253]